MHEKDEMCTILSVCKNCNSYWGLVWDIKN